MSIVPEQEVFGCIYPQTESVVWGYFWAEALEEKYDSFKVSSFSRYSSSLSNSTLSASGVVSFLSG